MRHPQIKLPTPTVHAAHPLRNNANHNLLLQYLQQRLDLGKKQRDSKLERMAAIDRDVAGWMKLSDEDKKRQRKKDEDGSPIATTIKLPLTYVHLDDMMTYFAATFSPNRGMFYHTGKPDEVSEANQIITLMNNHAIYAGYYREVLLTTFNCMKYNLGGFYSYWATDSGPKLSKNAQGADIVTTETKWQGNRVEALDMYNTFWDPHVHPTKLNHEGEWCGRAMMRSHYWLKNKCAAGVFFNCEDLLANDNGISETIYYRHPPTAARMNENESLAGAGVDYASWFSETPDFAHNSGFELTEIHIRLNPVDFGLIDGNAAAKQERNRYETWRFTIANNERIIECTYMNNIHGMLPFHLGVVNDDLMGQSQKAVSEIIMPLQDFASFLLNIHVQANRKNVWGLTVYDPTMVDLGDMKDGEVSARVPLKAAGYGKDVRTAVWRDNATLDTKQTMGDVDSVMAIINQFFPTQSLPSQIASIDRAVGSQVAAVQQGANRRMHKTARLLDDTMFRGMRFSMYYNIIQFQPDNAVVNDFYGREVTIDLSKLRTLDLPFIIGQGLKALDRQAASESLQTLIFALIQNPMAAQRLDLIGLIDYWTSMIDIDVDMKQFHLQPAAPTQTGPEAGIANGAPGAEAAGVAPNQAEVAGVATNPAGAQGAIPS
jgi:hypothetical protein